MNKKPDTYEVMAPSPRMALAVVTGLAALSVISLGLLINRQGAMGDFWYVVAQFEDGILSSWQWDTSRPLVGIVWELMWRIFGYHFLGWYVMILVTQALSAIILWHLLWRYFKVPWTLAALGAAFALVYPSDSAHVYIAAMTNRHAILCCLLAVWTWLAAGQQTDKKRLIAFDILCVIFLTVGLLLYEGPLGLVMLFPLLFLAVNLGSLRIWSELLRRWAWLAIWYMGIFWFVFYRLVLEPILPKIINPQLVVLTFSPVRIAQELIAWPATTLWKGWLYAPVAALRIESPVVMVAAALFIAISCFLLFRWSPAPNRRFFIVMTLVGILLLMVSSFPIIISSLEVSTMVGTLFGRTLSSAAFGHALIVVGLIGWLTTYVRTLGPVLATVLLSLATAESIGIQVAYAQVWVSQLRVVAALQEYAPQLPDNATIVLLDMPSGPYEIRYAFPFTRLVRVIYGNKTLQVAPWLAGYPPEQQLFMFGDKSLVIVETLDQLATIERPYQSVIAFRYNPNGPMTPVMTIPAQYLLPSGKTWFVNPTLVGRQDPFDITPANGANTSHPELSPGRSAIFEECQRLLNACR